MTANKIVKSFMVTFAILALVILFLIIASYLSYAFNKQRDVSNQRSANKQELIKQDSGQSVEVEELTEVELLRLVNPGKTDEEILEIKASTDALPYRSYAEEDSVIQTSF